MRKKLVVLCLMGILTLGAAGAALVDYLSNTISTTTTVESPIELDDSNWTFNGNLIAGDSHFLLVNITNKANVTIDGMADLYIEKWNASTETWDEYTGDGIYVAASDDIEYAFNETYNPTGDPWDTWMADHWSWFDWMTTEENTLQLVEMTQEIKDMYPGMYDGITDGTTCYMIPYKNYEIIDPDLIDINNDPDILPGLIFQSGGHFTAGPIPLDPGSHHAVVKISADPALEPGLYRFSLTITPYNPQ